VPPGDIRNCLCALSPMSSLQKDIFQYRFKSDDQFFAGHAIGNLIIAALTEMHENNIFDFSIYNHHSCLWISKNSQKKNSHK